jgi:hypothetical protein
MSEGCSKRFAPHYFLQSLTKIEKCEVLKAWYLMFLPCAYRVLSHSGRLRRCSEFLKWRVCCRFPFQTTSCNWILWSRKWKCGEHP